MAKKIITKDMLTTNQFETITKNIEIIRHLRANPVFACEVLLGIRLLDYQAWMLTNMWYAKDSVVLMSRNGGKTIISAILVELTLLLYPEQEIWVVSKTGKQAQKLFSYVERLATNSISTFGSLPDIFEQEIRKHHEKSTGFSHDPSGHRVVMLNDSYCRTVNGIPDNARGERGTLVLYDESFWIPEELFAATEPYTTGDTGFETSTDEFFDLRAKSKNKFNQRVYISSAGERTAHTYKRYRDYALRMLAGDKDFFVADLTVDIPLSPTMKGKKTAPLLNKTEVDTAMQANPRKAMREYYNVIDEDSEDQIISGATIDRCSTFSLPEISPSEDPDVKYTLAYDPASTADNSIILVGKILYDEKRGYYGQVVNIKNFKDLTSKHTNKQKTYMEQRDELRELLVRYNGEHPEYQRIQGLAIDAGRGGGGILYSHTLMEDWTDTKGEIHRGVIDPEYFEDKKRSFPNAFPVVKMLEPTSAGKNLRIKQLIELMDLGLIEFPYEYNGSGSVDIDVECEDGEIKTTRRKLTSEEEIALMNIDLCKEETKMIHKYTNPNGNIVYKTRVDVTMHDDRFDALVMFANELYNLRDEENFNKKRKKKSKRKVFGLIN